jgi:hypothetical protein
MVESILIGAAVLVVAIVVVVAVQAAAFRVERSALIVAPAGEVFERVNVLRAWEEWSPWAKIDPGMRQTYEGPAAGVGAAMAWSGNGKVGAGRMTITESVAGKAVRIRLEFLRPFKATNQGEFLFEREGEGTRVTWGMTGEKNFMSKAFGLVMDMDKMIGRDFEKGLAQLKAASERGSSAFV